MKNVFYYMNVSWSWAKQRPHFIAENLTRYFRVDVYYEKYFHASRLSQNTAPAGLSVTELFRLPFERFAPIAALNNLMIALRLRRVIKNYEVIWITSPFIYQRLRSIIPKNSKLVYDCMDDHSEFSIIKNSPSLSASLLRLEKELVQQADLVFCSSAHLNDKISARYGVQGKPITINNSLELKPALIDPRPVSAELKEKMNAAAAGCKYKAIYIGTISEWMNFELIRKAAGMHPDVAFLFFGPSEVVFPTSARIVHMGAIPHDQVYGVMKEADVLLMPFLLTQLILSVDPVKLYEYIYSCVPSVAVGYGETQKFGEYVYLYNNDEDFIKYIGMLTEGRLMLKKPAQQYVDFARKNNWENRVAEVARYID